MLKGRNLTLRYSFLQLFVWFCFAPIMGYTSVYLLSKGFSNTTIGIVSAAGGIASALLQPIVARYADKEKSLSLKWIVALIALAMLFGSGIMLIFREVPEVGLVFYAVLITAVQMIVPFLNALGMESINAGAKLDFGITRGAGSLGYAFISFVLGKTADQYGVDIIPFSILSVSVFLVFSTMLFPFEKRERKMENKGKGEESGSFLRKNPVFALFLLGISFVFVGHNFINLFIFQIITFKEGVKENMGVAISIAALSEIPIMFGFTFLLKKWKSGILVKLGTFVMFLKALTTLFVHDMMLFYGIQIMQAFGFGIFIVAQAYYINEIMPEKDKIKGQAFITTTGTLGVVVASLLGGSIIDNYGTETMMIASVIFAGVGSLISFVAVGKMKNQKIL